MGMNRVPTSFAARRPWFGYNSAFAPRQQGWAPAWQNRFPPPPLRYTNHYYNGNRQYGQTRDWYRGAPPQPGAGWRGTTQTQPRYGNGHQNHRSLDNNKASKFKRKNDDEKGRGYSVQNIGNAEDANEQATTATTSESETEANVDPRQDDTPENDPYQEHHQHWDYDPYQDGFADFDYEGWESQPYQPYHESPQQEHHFLE